MSEHVPIMATGLLVVAAITAVSWAIGRLFWRTIDADYVPHAVESFGLGYLLTVGLCLALMLCYTAGELLWRCRQ